MAILLIVVVVAAATGHSDTASSAGKWIISIVVGTVALIALGALLMGISSLFGNKDEK